VHLVTQSKPSPNYKGSTYKPQLGQLALLPTFSDFANLSTEKAFGISFKQDIQFQRIIARVQITEKSASLDQFIRSYKTESCYFAKARMATFLSELFLIFMLERQSVML